MTQLKEIKTHYDLYFGGVGVSMFEIIYSHSSRAYHNADHINSMFKTHLMFEEIEGNFDFNILHQIITLATLFHDIVYDPLRKDNEQKSVEFFKAVIESSDDYMHRDEYHRLIERMILATTHLNNELTEDPSEFDKVTMYFCDLDLTGIGSDWDTFNKNTDNVKKEFMLFGTKESDFVKGRIKFWEGLKERGRLYYNPYDLDFYKKAEIQGLDNINRELQFLKQELSEFNH